MPTAAYPVEIEPPDLTPYRAGNTGVDYVWTFAGSLPGPHVMVSAVVHGNELCGAIVLDELLAGGVRPARGKLTLAFANPEALLRFDRRHPTLSRFVDEDFNRLWSSAVLDGARTSTELARARELRDLVENVDYLLDLHSMQYGREPLALCGPTEKGRALARALGFPRHVVSDEGHVAGIRMRDYGAFNDDSSHRASLLLECGEHWRVETVTVAREMTWRFLAHFELVDAGQAAEKVGPPMPGQQLIEVTAPVTARTANFRFIQPYQGLEVIEKAGTIIGHDGEESVATPYDDCVLIMPSRRLGRGGTAVRFGRYVE